MTNPRDDRSDDALLPSDVWDKCVQPEGETGALICTYADRDTIAGLWETGFGTYYTIVTAP
jgi:hypothetical protein